MERAAGIEAPPRAAYFRGILAERERVINHLWDMGALCNDVGFGFRFLPVRPFAGNMAEGKSGIFPASAVNGSNRSRRRKYRYYSGSGEANETNHCHCCIMN